MTLDTLFAGFLKAKYNLANETMFGFRPSQHKTISISGFYLSFGIISLFLLPAYGFHYLEGWSYADSIYFTVISLTTIGFGDFSPSFEGIEETGIPFMAVYRIPVLFWMIIGLARKRFLWISRKFALRYRRFRFGFIIIINPNRFFVWKYRNYFETDISSNEPAKASGTTDDYSPFKHFHNNFHRCTSAISPTRTSICHFTFTWWKSRSFTGLIFETFQLNIELWNRRKGFLQSFSSYNWTFSC